ncbi:MAG TPA: IS1595 family transposase [Terriglobales bacterium]|nr:IS1595 family transposase [Terriglobales bacterium]
MPLRIHPKPMSIQEIFIQFSTEQQCLEYVEKMRWPDGIVRCPTCGDKNVKRVMRKAESKNKRPWFYLCLNKDCHQQFSPTAGTLFADSHLPLIVWFHAIGLILNAKKGISAKQLQRDLGIGGYKTAWYLNHRIRESMKDLNPEPLGGVVEIDETYVGGKIRGGKSMREIRKSKKVVMGAVQRGGKLRLRHVPDAKIETISGFVKAHLSPDVERVMTDYHSAYPPAFKPDLTDRHERVNHIVGEYVRGDVTTNSIESAFSLLKRGIIGQFHKLSGKHLHRYLAEFEYRFNHRKDSDVFIQTVKRLCGVEPLRFAALTSDENA